MTKLRNIGYLRFGSKILQGFAGFFTSLSPPLSLSPLWISWAKNEGRRGKGRSFIFEEGACRPLPGGRPSAANWWGGKGAAGSHQEPLRKINLFLFTYRSLVPPCRAVGPLPPPCRTVGVQNCKI